MCRVSGHNTGWQFRARGGGAEIFIARLFACVVLLAFVVACAFIAGLFLFWVKRLVGLIGHLHCRCGKGVACEKAQSSDGNCCGEYFFHGLTPEMEWLII
jgi:hypothetical protein